MNNEKQLQQFISNSLLMLNDEALKADPPEPLYRKGLPEEYDKSTGIVFNDLIKFIELTQEDKLKKLIDIYGSSWRSVLLSSIPKTTYEAVKFGIPISGQSRIKFDIIYTKPNNTSNETVSKMYSANQFTVIEEVTLKNDKERVDLVILLNGFPVFVIELKSNMSGKGYVDAITQFKTERTPNDPLFKKAVCMFAMDEDQCYMTTKLEKRKTTFRPFNRGKGQGANRGAGNDIPENEDKYPTYYMWEQIFKPDMVLDLLTKFIIRLNDKKQTLIFPRFHQIEVVQKLVNSAYKTVTKRNYLLHHSAGSGKTYEIAWLAYRLALLNTEDCERVYDKVIVCTDRTVITGQLQSALYDLNITKGMYLPITEKMRSKDLEFALKNDAGCRIIATTAQKFNQIADKMKPMKNKKFAVIIDEAHSSTEGKQRQAINRTFSDEETPQTVEDLIGAMTQPKNLCYFAFTATPKATTLALFGSYDETGKKAPFHTYTMKQAIEEGYIVDVLKNYTTYSTAYELSKTIKEDPIYKTANAKKAINTYVIQHPETVEQKASIIVEHFNNNVKHLLDGQAKAMVVCDSRQSAVNFKIAIDEYINKHRYGLETLVAFTGKIDGKGEEKYNNGLSSDAIAPTFHKTDGPQFLVVANKFQTGFDEKFLCAMYIDKRMQGVNLVQTLSRLNRVCGNYDKTTYVLDFRNEYEDVQDAFAEYYGNVQLANNINPTSIDTLYRNIMQKNIFTETQIDEIFNMVEDPNVKRKMYNKLKKIKGDIDDITSEVKRKRFVQDLRGFVRCYEFLIQLMYLESTYYFKLYRTILLLLPLLSATKSPENIDLTDKLKLERVNVHFKEEYLKSELEAKRDKILSEAKPSQYLEENAKMLSEIIAEVNRLCGSEFEENQMLDLVSNVVTKSINDQRVLKWRKDNTPEDFAKCLHDTVIENLAEQINQYAKMVDTILIKPDILNVFTNLVAREIDKAVVE